MADGIRRAKTCLTLAVMTALLISGCAGRPLIEREIVRAVFFTREDGKNQAILLLQDQKSEDSSDYETAKGEGTTAAQALEEASAALDGVTFYGLTDLVGLPAGSSWEDVQEYAALLYETAQPSPEITLFLLDSRSAGTLQQTAGELYNEMQAAEKKYQIQCGLESLMSQEGEAALPCWQQNGYGFAVLKQGQPPLRYAEPVRSQLAAVLCGQSKHLEFVIADGAISCRADVEVLFQAAPTGTTVLLRLGDASLSALTEDVPKQDAELRQILTRELQTAFSQLCSDMEKLGADPFRLSFWQTCLLGNDSAEHLPVSLCIEYT